jgi:uncharacterized protein (DUF433 family)
MNVVGAFTTNDVSRLTGLSKRQVVYWDTTGVYSPSIARGGARQPHGRIYSFRDVVALRALALIRGNVSLQQIRRTGAWLCEHYASPWSRLRFYLWGDRIVYSDPETGEFVSTAPPWQRVIPFDLVEIAVDMTNRFKELQRRKHSAIGQVERHRYVVRNDYVLAGTRIPTQTIWEFHRATFDIAAIQREYPELTQEDIRAAIEFEQQRHAS